MPEALVFSLVSGGVPIMWYRACDLSCGVLVGRTHCSQLIPETHCLPYPLLAIPAFWPRGWGESCVCVYSRERALNLPSLSLATWSPYSIASGCSGPLSACLSFIGVCRISFLAFMSSPSLCFLAVLAGVPHVLMWLSPTSSSSCAAHHSCSRISAFPISFSVSLAWPLYLAFHGFFLLLLSPGHCISVLPDLWASACV